MIKTAIKAAEAAGEILLTGFGKTQPYNFKQDKTTLSEFDTKSESIILSILQEEFPRHKILSEEAGEIDSNSDYLWVIDPLDGTTNFTRGIPLFSVVLSLVYQQEQILSVIYNPVLNQLYTAEKGKGAFRNREQIYVSKISSLAKATLDVGKGHDEKSIELFPMILKNLLLSGRTTRQFGSCGIELAYVSSGSFDAKIDYGNKPWDYAAGALLVTEAGGKVTDINGDEFNIQSKSILATNGLLHEQVLTALQNVGN